MSVSDWTVRVRPFLNSRHYAVLLIGAALLFDGFAIFMFDDVAKHTPFWSNVLVLYAFTHAGLMLLIAISMSIKLWQWRMEQLAIVNCFSAFALFNLLLPSYLAIAIYSAAAFELKLFLWLILLCTQGWFARRIFLAYKKAWSDPELKRLMLVEKEDHFIFFQEGEILVREKIGVRAHGSIFIMVIFLLMGFATYFVRIPLISYFDVSWVPIAYAVMVLPFATLATALLVTGIQYFIYSRRITLCTGKVVYLDNMSKPPNK